ncbi:MAG: 3,4-dihydroxy-2-butanone-4-phosphate synthase [Francisellaceae bacterium]
MYEEVEKRVLTALAALKEGKCIIITDSEDRENEGDIVFPAELADEKRLAFALKYTSGIVCLAMSKAQAKRLDLDYMVPSQHNNSRFQTPFTISIEAASGVSTGVSAKDRAHTIKVAANVNADPLDLSRPGHIFPLIAHDLGVFARPGHTEASVDIVRLAGFRASAVLSELMDEDGRMMKGETITKFAEAHDLVVISIEDIRRYRLKHDGYLDKAVSSNIPLSIVGECDISVFHDALSAKETIVISKNITDNPLVRLHSSCITGDLFGSLKCDCQSQLNHALSRIKEEGGILIYLNQEGRGIGLVNKLKAYELQRTQGLNTIDANLALGLKVDARDYDAAIEILYRLAITHCRLLTNNPDKIKAVEEAGIVVTREASFSAINAHNLAYLQTKNTHLAHEIEGIETSASL